MLRIEFETDNAAFESRAEIARILRQVAVEVMNTGRTERAIVDANGNKVGKWELDSRADRLE